MTTPHGLDADASTRSGARAWRPFDVGGALDLRVIPHVGLGAHIEYATIDAQPYTPEWIALGLHVDIIF